MLPPAHYKCSNNSRSLTGYISRPPRGEVPLPMAPPQIPPSRPWSNNGSVVPSSSVVDVVPPPPPTPPVVPFNVFSGKKPPPQRVVREYGRGLLRGKSSSSGYKGK